MTRKPANPKAYNRKTARNWKNDSNSVLSEKGKVDPEKLHALMFDQFQNGYYTTGEKVGRAWNAGAGWMKK